MNKLLLPLLSLLLFSCATQTPTDGAQGNNLTVGVVQKEIKVGMDATAVVEAIGSPNIVKKNAEGGETWVYDRFSSEQVTQSVGGALAFFGSDTAAGVSASSGRTKTESHALTVIIKFDESDVVKSLAYHRSKF